VYRACIIDDEPSIRSGMKHILPWEEYGIELIGEAADGAAGYALLAAERPDLAICDIRMPAMDGLELIRRAHADGLETRFVILSGYDDFQYVKEALQYNVENYLLKPMNIEEMEQTIHQITRKLESDASRSRERTQERELIRNNVLNRLLTNHIDGPELKQKLAFLQTGANVFDSKLQAAVIDVVAGSTEARDRIDAALRAAEEAACRAFPPDRAVVFPDYAGRIVIVCGVANEAEHNERMREDLLSLYERLPNLEDARWVVTAGSVARSYKQLHVSYGHALRAQQYRIYSGDTVILLHEDIVAKQSAFRDYAAVDHLLLEDALKHGRREELREYIEGSFDRLARGGAEPEAVYFFAMEVVISLLRILRLAGVSQDEIFGDEMQLLRYIRELEHIDKIRFWLNGKIQSTLRALDERNGANVSKVVKDLLQYIDRHAHEDDVSLKSYSQKIHYNAVYLGRIFRKETGEVFSDYVNKVRIEKSKTLLRGSSMKINDISAAVGFTNRNYYFNIFKKLVGMTPSEYRNRMEL